MSGNSEKTQELEIQCPKCGQNLFKRYFRDYGVAMFIDGWREIDYDYYDMQWDDEDWVCVECGEEAPEHVKDEIERIR